MTDFTERLQTAVVDRYRIERRLGEGGMATVYLAHDLKHDRPVALKVLRPELAAVIGAERFLAEIRTTANLQHPNILPLFDSGDADGQLFYVMPYVEGESLRERLEREKQLPVEDAVKMGVEVASALDYAHRQGVVHRDIKPENILLHDGRALVADFGIALALSTAGGSRMTETGMSVGTPAYMSPEQAMGGHEVTGRSDVYALGATLYEALVGEPPFTGPTAQAIIARLVTEDPRPLVSQRKTVPAHVEAAVLTALERLPADRFATAAEFGEALEGRLKVPAHAGHASAASSPGRRRTLVELSGRGVLLIFVGALALVAVAAWGWLRPGPQPLASRQTIKLGSVDFPSGIALGTAIAPDGSAIVFPDSVGNAPQLWIKERGELDPRVLVKMSSMTIPPGPAFSPDGKWIVYTDGKPKKIARTGGAPIALSDSGAAYGAAWLDDGTIAFIGSNGDGLYTTTAEGAPTKRLKLVAGADSVAGPLLRVAPIPGADAVLLGVGPPYNGEVAVDLATGVEHPLTRGGIGAWIVPGGDVVYAQANGALFAAPFDMHGLALAGAPVSVVDQVRMTTGMADANMGAGGTLLYIQGSTTNDAARQQLVSVGRDGTVTPLDTAWTVILGQNGGADLSPDGT
ncbi:MAG: protein kinase, partial [Gemmatimonadota bacterium]